MDVNIEQLDRILSQDYKVNIQDFYLIYDSFMESIEGANNFCNQLIDNVGGQVVFDSRELDDIIDHGKQFISNFEKVYSLEFPKKEDFIKFQQMKKEFAKLQKTIELYKDKKKELSFWTEFKKQNKDFINKSKIKNEERYTYDNVVKFIKKNSKYIFSAYRVKETSLYLQFILYFKNEEDLQECPISLDIALFSNNASKKFYQPIIHKALISEDVYRDVLVEKVI